jgi:hypothetical protein
LRCTSFDVAETQAINNMEMTKHPLIARFRIRSLPMKQGKT